MATLDDVKILRPMINEPGSNVYDDQALMDIIDQADGDLDLAAATIWEQKAGRFSTLVDVSESGSSRSNSQTYKNALAQAQYYSKKVSEAAVVEVEAVRPSRTRTAVRK